MQLITLVADHMTPANVSMGVCGTLAIAGCLHALPGPTLRLQAKHMGMPSWFILCAGLLMLCSAAAYFVNPGLGLYAVALCMGGAAATAAKMPKPMHRPGGLVCSSATLAAALWAAHEQSGGLPSTAIAISATAYMMGVAGRLLVPTNALAIKLLGARTCTEKKKGSSHEEAVPVNKSKENVKPAGLSTSCGKAMEPAKEAGARKRTASPAPARKPDASAVES